MKRLPAVRERTEDFERASLSIWATLASESKGRDRHEQPDLLRTAFQTDRDRILTCDAFRRMARKRRRAVRGDGRDRSCLVHALEVSQVARTAARALRLNEDLVEAIALGQDVGHAPFGHAGEEALAVFGPVPFRHAEQGLRVVERLSGEGDGLNLSWEVRDGIVNHSWDGGQPATVEGQVVRLANRVVGLTADLEGAVVDGALRVSDIPVEVRATLGERRPEQIDRVVDDVVGASIDQPEVQLGSRVHTALAVLAESLEPRLGRRPPARSESDRAVHCLRSLAVFLLENPSLLPPRHSGSEPLETRVCDAIAEMSDPDAVDEFNRRFQPTPG